MDLFVSTKADIEQDCLGFKSLRTKTIHGKILIGELGFLVGVMVKTFSIIYSCIVKLDG